MTDSLPYLNQLLTTVSAILLILMAIPLAMTLQRKLKGPHHADRFVALDMLAGIAVAIAALAAAVAGRREFMDVGLGLAIFGFVGTCALATFLERKGKTNR